MSGPVIASSEPGLVAIEWAKAEIPADLLRLEAHAALLTLVHRAARDLGARPSNGGAVVYTVHRGEVDEALRFVWGAEP